MPRRKLPKIKRSNSRPNIVSKRSRNVFSRRKSNRKPTNPHWLQSLFVWLLVTVIGVCIAWYVIIWGVIPKLLESAVQSKTVAIVPAVAEGAVVVINFEDQLKKSDVFLLNGDEMVYLPGKYGEYRLSAVYPLLQIEQKDTRYVMGSMNRVTGVFLDQLVDSPTALSSSNKELREQIVSLFWQKLIDQKKLEPTLLATWYVLQYESAVTSDAVVSTVAARLEKETGGTFAARDECSIAILNSTDTPGLAGRLADIVENNGGVVIRLGQYSDKVESSTIMYDPAVAACAAALEQIETLSPVPFEMKADPTIQNSFRAPIVAIIGENFE